MCTGPPTGPGALAPADRCKFGSRASDHCARVEAQLLSSTGLPARLCSGAGSRLALAWLLGPWPTPWRQTVTFDNGTEFARHHELQALGLETFFCDPHAPWQKGGVENAIGRLRRGLPRKCLDYRTPAEVFWQDLLHFKCESTFPPPPE